MSFKDIEFRDRAASAAQARKSALEKFRARPPADDPAVLQRQAERSALNAARHIRAAQREEGRGRAQEVQRALRLERELQEATEASARREREVVKAAEDAERELALEGARKAARDARYAARKARK